MISWRFIPWEVLFVTRQLWYPREDWSGTFLQLCRASSGTKDTSSSMLEQTNKEPLVSLPYKYGLARANTGKQTSPFLLDYQMTREKNSEEMALLKEFIVEFCWLSQALTYITPSQMKQFPSKNWFQQIRQPRQPHSAAEKDNANTILEQSRKWLWEPSILFRSEIFPVRKSTEIKKDNTFLVSDFYILRETV